MQCSGRKSSQSKRFREVDALILCPLGRDTFYHRDDNIKEKAKGKQGEMLLLNNNKTKSFSKSVFSSLSPYQHVRYFLIFNFNKLQKTIVKWNKNYLETIFVSNVPFYLMKKPCTTYINCLSMEERRLSNVIFVTKFSLSKEISRCILIQLMKERSFFSKRRSEKAF